MLLCIRENSTKNFFLESSSRNKASIQLPVARRVLCITIVSLSPLLWVCAGEKPKIWLSKFLRVEHPLFTHPTFGHPTNLLFSSTIKSWIKTFIVDRTGSQEPRLLKRREFLFQIRHRVRSGNWSQLTNTPSLKAAFHLPLLHLLLLLLLILSFLLPHSQIPWPCLKFHPSPSLTLPKLITATTFTTAFASTKFTI